MAIRAQEYQAFRTRCDEDVKAIHLIAVEMATPGPSRISSGHAAFIARQLAKRCRAFYGILAW